MSSNDFLYEKSGGSEVNIDLIVNAITSEINYFACLSHKTFKFVEPKEIEVIKNVILKIYRVPTKTREALENELTKFEEEIKQDFRVKVLEYNEKRIACEEQADKLQTEKKKFILRNLLKFSSSFYKSIEIFDRKIKKLKMQANRYSDYIMLTGVTRPVAQEKDILLFKIHLKQKFAA